MIAVLIDVLLPIAVVAAAGYGLRRALPLDLPTLNRVMIYGLSPALIFVALVRADIAGGSALRVIALSILVVASMALATYVCAAPLGLRGPDLSALMLACLFMNTGNYGLPAAQFAFGDAGFQQAVLYFIPQSMMAQTLGIGVAAAGGGASPLAGLRRALRSVLTMPNLYAVLAALAVRAAGLRLAEAPGLAGALYQGVELLSAAALPLMLTILGMQLAEGVTVEQPGLVALATVLRLVVSPLIAYGLARALGLSGAGLSVGVMMAGMPTAVNTTILALEFNARPTLVVGAVVATSLGSLLTLSVMLSWLR